MSSRIVRWQGGGRGEKRIEAFLARASTDVDAEGVAAEVLRSIREQGDRAVCRYAEAFDGVRLRPAELRVSGEEFEEAAGVVTRVQARAVRAAMRRVARFARAGLRADWSLPTGRGGVVGERYVPLDRVGVYVPGGAAPLVSTVIMTVTLARVAGVKEIVVCTPCGADGRVAAPVLYALEVCGATEVYRVGGIQAIGMMAYGTQTVRAVRKIVGPGGPYVTAAKRQVYGHVGLDMVAGPSEIAVLADETAEAGLVAADLLSQAEHGTGRERVLLATTSLGLAREVDRELRERAASLGRSTAVARVLEEGTLLVVVKSMEDAVELCNRFAPEHLEVMARGAGRWARGITNAGAVFLGPWTPEPVGDYVAGPSHVLPTGGAAAWSSGLTVDDFRRRMSVMRYTRADMEAAWPTIEAIGAMEGMGAHVASAAARVDEGKAGGVRGSGRKGGGR